MDHRERITTAVAAPHLARPVGSLGVGGGGGSHRMAPQSNGSLSRGSTLERPTARSVMINQQQPPNGVQHHHPHLITTTVEVEHPRPSAMRSNGQAATSGANPATYQANPANQILLPKTIVIIRNDHHGFGFTLRHFIVYPPAPGSHGHHEDFPPSLLGGFQLTEPMDTVFVKEVRPNGPAHVAGLKTGDRLLTVNGLSVNGMQYAHVVSTIQQVPTVLTLQVVPKECDILQTCFSAHHPETNQRPRHSAEAASLMNNSGFGHQQQQPPVMPLAATPYPQHVSLQSPNVAAAAAAIGVQLHSPGKRRESLASLSSHDSNMKEIEESNAAIAMLRLKKNIEQKEEFMRRPQNQNHQQQQNQQVQQMQQQPGWRPVVASYLNGGGQGMAREFYSRPKKLQKPVWPPSLEEQQQQQMRKNLCAEQNQNQFVPIQKPLSSSTASHHQQMQQNKLMKSK